MNARSNLEIDLNHLEDFEPAAPKPSSPKKRTQEKKRIAEEAYFPSRESEDREQLNIGVPRALKKRFKELSQRTGLRHYALLQQALDAFERDRERT